MRTLGLAMMITGGLVIWFALGKSVQSGKAQSESSGGSGFEGGTSSGGNSGGGGGSW